MYGATEAGSRTKHAIPSSQPYACAKVFAHHMSINYREAYGLHVSSRHPLQPRITPSR